MEWVVRHQHKEMSIAMGYLYWRCMFTGKRPTDKIFKDGFNLHNFVKMTLTEKLVQVVDPNLLTREVEDLEVATKEDDYNNDDHDDIEAVEERALIENLSQ
jgi:hypothetical protein